MARNGEACKKTNVRTALVLSGGGAKGAYQIGVIQELLRKGIVPELIIGSSIGAFNGALTAEFIKKGFAVDRVSKELENVWKEINNFLTIDWPVIIKNFFRPQNIPSIFSNKNIKYLLNKYIVDDRKFYDYKKCNLSVTTTNLNLKTSKIFDYKSKELVKKAVLASMAYPVALPAIKIGEENHIDGGVLNNTPLKEAIMLGAEQIIVIFLTPITIIKAKNEKQIKKIFAFKKHFSDVQSSEYSAMKVLEELFDLATETMMYGDLKVAEKINKLLRLLYLYQDNLPSEFLQELKKIYKLKKDSGKRIINIIKVAPDSILEPPGTVGFNNKGAIKDLIIKGRIDMKNVLLNKKVLKT